MKKLAIIGSGLTGLTLASRLQHKFDITVFEKARGVGGRLATRRGETYAFDHGAQYFTTRTESFRAFIQPLIDEGLVQQWTARHVEINGTRIVKRSNWKSEEPRYVGAPGMNSIAKRLAQKVDIKKNVKITSLLHQDDWQLEDEQGILYKNFEWVISTAPAPQTLQLVPENFIHYDAVKAIEMSGCYSLMLGLSKELSLPFDAAHVINSDISWIAVNSHKPQRGNGQTLVVHSSADYAEKHIDSEHDAVINHLCERTSHIIQHDVSQAQHKVLHGWRYANNVKRETYQPFIDHNLKIAACGDWCLGGRVEGAFNSAQNLADAIETR
ncbi:NAD(P)-binding protein [Burkholderiales bacterium]|nr:NAD(P)-binding protein [Burkholderiales bacterium]